MLPPPAAGEGTRINERCQLPCGAHARGRRLFQTSLKKVSWMNAQLASAPIRLGPSFTGRGTSVTGPKGLDAVPNTRGETSPKTGLAFRPSAIAGAQPRVLGFTRDLKTRRWHHSCPDVSGATVAHSPHSHVAERWQHPLTSVTRRQAVAAQNVVPASVDFGYHRMGVCVWLAADCTACQLKPPAAQEHRPAQPAPRANQHTLERRSKPILSFSSMSILVARLLWPRRYLPARPDPPSGLPHSSNSDPICHKARSGKCLENFDTGTG